MIHHVDRLHEIGHKEERLIIGLMSGTSLDGLDIALCRIVGQGESTRATVEAFVTIPYDEETNQQLQDISFQRTADLQQVCIMHSHLGRMYAQMILQALKLWQRKPEDIDLIASHGQTIYHAPKSLHQQGGRGHSTLQIVDGDHIAQGTGIITVSDFRLKHIAAGGEGAPLALYGDYLLYSHEEENRILLNIGGIANFTWLPNREYISILPPLASDVGPGNTVMNQYARLHLQQDFDHDGMWAAEGMINQDLLVGLMQHPFYQQALPKSVGPELFNKDYLDHALDQLGTHINPVDVMATLNYWTAASIAHALNNALPMGVFHVYISGGGCHNKTLMRHLQDLCVPHVIQYTDALGIASDAKEALLFGVLANECVAGKAAQGYNAGPFVLDVSMGKISFPS